MCSNPILSTRGTRNGLLGKFKPHSKYTRHAKWIPREVQPRSKSTFANHVGRWPLGGGAISGISDVDSMENKGFLLFGTVPFYGAPPIKKGGTGRGDHSPPAEPAWSVGTQPNETRNKPRGGCHKRWGCLYDPCGILLA